MYLFRIIHSLSCLSARVNAKCSLTCYNSCCRTLIHHGPVTEDFVMSWVGAYDCRVNIRLDEWCCGWIYIERSVALSSPRAREKQGKRGSLFSGVPESGTRYQIEVLSGVRYGLPRSDFWSQERYLPSKGVCLSVRPSVCHDPVLCQNGWTYRWNSFAAWQPFHSSFLSLIDVTKIPTRSPLTGILNTGGV